MIVAFSNRGKTKAEKHLEVLHKSGLKSAKLVETSKYYYQTLLSMKDYLKILNGEV